MHLHCIPHQPLQGHSTTWGAAPHAVHHPGPACLLLPHLCSQEEQCLHAGFHTGQKPVERQATTVQRSRRHVRLTQTSHWAPCDPQLSLPSLPCTHQLADPQPQEPKSTHRLITTLPSGPHPRPQVLGNPTSTPGTQTAWPPARPGASCLGLGLGTQQLPCARFYKLESILNYTPRD